MYGIVFSSVSAYDHEYSLTKDIAPLKTRINERVVERKRAIHHVFPRKFLRKISAKDATERTSTERLRTVSPSVKYTGVETGKN